MHMQVWFHNQKEVLKGWGSANEEGVAQLLLRFFAFYATEFDWERECISVRKGAVVPVSSSPLSCAFTTALRYLPVERLEKKHHVFSHISGKN